MTAAEILGALISALQHVQRILPTDQESWEEQPVVRLAVERLWITAGNLAEAYRLEVGISTGVEPWSELVGYRHLLAHALPGDVSTGRVWADSSTDLVRILDEVRTQPR